MPLRCPLRSLAQSRQVRFGSLNYTADTRGDLVFDGFEPRSSVPHCLDGHDLALPPDSAQSAAQVSAPIISSEPTALVGEGRVDAAPGAAISMAIEPNTSLVLCKARDSKVPDSVPDSIYSAPLPIEPNWAPTMEFTCKARDSKVPDSVPDSIYSAPLPIEPNWAPTMEFTTGDVFQHLPFGDILDLLKSLSLSGEPWPDYGQQGWDADDEEIRNPPTTHFVATVDDLTNMLDFDSEDIDGMDADAGDD